MCSRKQAVKLASGLPACLSSLESILGVWKGKGSGVYPTIPSFEYMEETSFTNVGKPFIAYTQKTKSEEGKPMHTESGFIRVRQSPDDGTSILELVLADPTGIASIYDGVIKEDEESLSIHFVSQSITKTASAKDVQGVERKIKVQKNTSPLVLTYTMSMEASGHHMQNHLTANLTKEMPSPSLLVSAKEVKEMGTNSVGFVDVREPEEFETGHHEGAKNFPLGKFLSTMRNTESDVNHFIKAHEKIVLYCASSGRGTLAATSARKAKFDHVVSLSVGYATWKSQ